MRLVPSVRCSRGRQGIPDFQESHHKFLSGERSYIFATIPKDDPALGLILIESVRSEAEVVLGLKA